MEYHLEKIWIKKINSGNMDDVLEEFILYINKQYYDFICMDNIEINFDYIINNIYDNNLINYFKGIKIIYQNIKYTKHNSIEYFKKSDLLDCYFLIDFISLKHLNKYNNFKKLKDIIKYNNLLNIIDKNRINLKNMINNFLDNIIDLLCNDIGYLTISYKNKISMIKYIVKKYLKDEKKFYYLSEIYLNNKNLKSCYYFKKCNYINHIPKFCILNDKYLTKIKLKNKWFFNISNKNKLFFIFLK